MPTNMQTLVKEFAASGVTVHTDNGEIVVRGAQNGVRAEISDFIRKSKPVILERALVHTPNPSDEELAVFCRAELRDDEAYKKWCWYIRNRYEQLDIHERANMAFQLAAETICNADPRRSAITRYIWRKMEEAYIPRFTTV